MNRYPATIIDNFFTEPDKVREWALTQTYTYNKDRPDVPYIFPGLRTDELHKINRSLFDEFCIRLMTILHNFRYESIEWKVLAHIQIISGEYETGWIHQDDNDTIIAGVIYLSPDAPLDAGTSLYKKNVNYNNEDYADLNNSKIKFYQHGTKDTNYSDHRNLVDNMFDETVKVNNCYNRDIFYEGDIFHKANNFFGNNLDDSRMTLVFSVSKLTVPNNEYPLSRHRHINNKSNI